MNELHQIKDHKLKMQSDVSSFIEHFQEISKTICPAQLALEVWILANAQWSRGYMQGTQDPEFENSDD